MFAVAKAIAVEKPDEADQIIYTFAATMTDKNEDYPNEYAVQEWIDLNGGWVSVYKMQQSSFPVNIITHHILHSIATQKRFVRETCSLNNHWLPMALTESKQKVLVNLPKFIRIFTELILFSNHEKSFLLLGTSCT